MLKNVLQRSETAKNLCKDWPEISHQAGQQGNLGMTPSAAFNAIGAVE